MVPPQDRPATCAGPSRNDSMRAASPSAKPAKVMPSGRSQDRPGPWFVPGHDGELVGQVGELQPPGTAVLGGTVDKDQQRPRTRPLVGNPQPVRPDKLHP